jgi:hypothetical protein
MGLRISRKIPKSRSTSDKVLSETPRLAGIIAQKGIGKEEFSIEGAT